MPSEKHAHWKGRAKHAPPISSGSWKAAEQAPSGPLADYYTRKELAHELGVTTRTLERWAWLRTGPARTRVGNRVFYSCAAVEKWLELQTEGEAVK